MVVACFASHIHRIQQIANVAHETGRKIAFMGRSMEANVKLARKLHLLRVDPADIIDVENISRFPPGEVCVICTGQPGRAARRLVEALARGRAQLQGRTRRHGDLELAPDSRATSGRSVG